MMHYIYRPPSTTSFFFFNDTATTEIYTLSLHDALPIYRHLYLVAVREELARVARLEREVVVVDPGTELHFLEMDHVLLLFRRPRRLRLLELELPDRKSTRLNSSHSQISYAVFCLKKKKNNKKSNN